MKYALTLLLLFFSSNFASAENYQVSVTRKGSNMYRVTGKNIIIFTRYCYEYVYYEDAILRLNSGIGSLHFLESKSSCDVKSVYAKTTIDNGRYKVTIEGDGGFYEVNYGQFLIEASLCLNIVIGDSAILVIRGRRFGEVTFSSGSKCTVDGIYSKLKK